MKRMLRFRLDEDERRFPNRTAKYSTTRCNAGSWFSSRISLAIQSTKCFTIVKFVLTKVLPRVNLVQK
jgi:hypothetical protein